MCKYALDSHHTSISGLLSDGWGTAYTDFRKGTAGVYHGRTSTVMAVW